MTYTGRDLVMCAWGPPHRVLTCNAVLLDRIRANVLYMHAGDPSVGDAPDLHLWTQADQMTASLVQELEDAVRALYAAVEGADPPGYRTWAAGDTFDYTVLERWESALYTAYVDMGGTPGPGGGRYLANAMVDGTMAAYHVYT